ncbi:S8 family serine peptidase [Brevibacillus sp. AY1]|uniref:S8 family serine peptidase n=1 Tax=Brevibacillus sp. AY1 TaxID=2807621 RepID=UPI002454E3D7|nr:S8 family serine peptidase [Brevibacillus sp. AY1]MDH4618390.1 S8 family serine peptidase [Brevibacillus sp. AY1]
MSKWRVILSSSLAVFLLCSSPPVYAKTPARDLDIDIEAKTIDPIPNKVKKSNYKSISNLQNSSNLFIIRFEGPIQEEWIEEVENLNVSLGWYLPDFAYIVKFPDKKSTEDKLQELPFVKDVAEFKPIYKIHPDLADAVDEKEKLEVYVEGFGPNTDLDKAVKKAGGKVARSSQDRNQTNVKIDSDDIHKLLNSDDIVYVAPITKQEFHNDVAGQIIGSNTLQKTKYDGKKQIVSVTDSGLDTGNLKTMHPDLQGQVSRLIPIGPDPRDFEGHGTHVLGSIVGKGTLSNGQVKGMAPAAKAIVYTVDDGAGGVLPVDYNKVWTDAYKKGARINSLSIGSSEHARYTYNSQLVDIFLWEHPDAISLVSAGNDGDEFLDEYYTVTPPATAKNVITVGASENYRPEYGYESDDADEVADFSSRGPTLDGRIKPDVVAPGTSIFSTRSIISNKYADIIGAYGLMSGTSMATPITAGGVAQIRQYLQENGAANPSGALMKALVISGADDLGDSLLRMGFGRVNLPNSVRSTYVDQKSGLRTGDTVSFQVEVKDTRRPFNATAVWTDYPASLFASRTLVNDLDLVVTSPSGKEYNGNDFDAQPDDERDNLNNVEQVYLGRPEKGIYTVSISGYNIPKGPQPFALASSGVIIPKLIDEGSIEASGVLTKDSIKITIKGKVDPSTNSVKINAPGIKNATAKISKSSFSYSKTVKAGSYPIEEVQITASNKKGTKELVSVSTEKNLIDDNSLLFEKKSSSGVNTYELSGTTSTDVKAMYYILNNKLIPISIGKKSFKVTFESKSSLSDLVVVAVNKNGHYEMTQAEIQY